PNGAWMSPNAKLSCERTHKMQRRSRCFHSSLVSCSDSLERAEAGAYNDPWPPGGDLSRLSRAWAGGTGRRAETAQRRSHGASHKPWTASRRLGRGARGPPHRGRPRRDRGRHTSDPSFATAPVTVAGSFLRDVKQVSVSAR